MPQLIPLADDARAAGLANPTLWVRRGVIRTEDGLVPPGTCARAKDVIDGTADLPDWSPGAPAPCNGHTVVDLFAGGGGTALGFDLAGFTHLAVNEINAHAAASLRINKPDWPVIEGDVHALDLSHLAGEVDVVEGGFPCQAFSHAGKGEGFADTRGTLVHELIRIGVQTKAKAIVGENVVGLLHHDKGRTLDVICARLREEGYTPYVRVLRAQFLGVAQKRERVFIVALRDDLNWHLPNGADSVFPEMDWVGVPLRAALTDVPSSPGASYSPARKAVMDLVPEGGNWRDLPEDVAREYLGSAYGSNKGGMTSTARRLAWNEPCQTLMCSPDQKQTSRCHPEVTRPLTVREYARVMSFPDEWQFTGSLTAQYTQIGNAVPVLMARRVAESVTRLLDGL